MTYLNDNEYIALIKHMCSKMGIDVTRCDVDAGNGNCSNRLYGKILTYSIRPMIDVIDALNALYMSSNMHNVPNVLLKNIYVRYDNYSSYASGSMWLGNEFTWLDGESFETFVMLCTCIKSFEVQGVDVAVANPFYKAYNMLEAKSIEEALVQADLFFPGDYTQEVHELVKKKEDSKQRR